MTPPMEDRRPGPKPRRLYVRTARNATTAPIEPPSRHSVHRFVENLERVGRLVSEGPLTQPVGHLLILRATDLAEANRTLRTDPWQDVVGAAYEVLEWDTHEFGSGVNLDPAPARGSGRLTLLERVAVFVRDQASATAWYVDVLGLKVREKDAETGFVELSLGRGAAALSLVAPRVEWGEPYYSETRARIGHATGIVFRTDSVEALELRLRHAGARVTEPARPQPWGGVTLRFADPDGNEFLAFQTESGHPSGRAGALESSTQRRTGARPGGGRAGRSRPKADNPE